MPNLSHDRLLEVLDYDEASGVFSWKIRPSNRIHVGDRAGVQIRTGHRFINVDGEKLQASRLAWFYVHKEWPQGDIKFSDGNPDNVAISNLSDVSRIQAARMRKALARNTSGYKGVSQSTHEGKWQAAITWNYKQASLGSRYETAEDAAEVYNDAERRLRDVTSPEEGVAVLKALLLEKRQRAIWNNLARQNIVTSWLSFEDFCKDVAEVLPRRFAIAPKDATKPMGPTNWVWASDNGINPQTDRIAYNRARRIANQDFFRGKDFQKKYGIDFAEYQRMLEAQGGVCACCGRGETKMQNGAIRLLSVDHDHKTGAVRSLLCGNCNMGIGYFADDVDLLRKAIDYLESHRTKALSAAVKSNS